jgi:predicted metal-dependent HD superfamily phosphohydrolase
LRQRLEFIVSDERWRALCRDLGLSNGAQEHKKLVSGWRSFGRRYHTLDHLAACLRELDGTKRCAEHPAEVEAALWFHDAVYRTWRRDNEARSAAWARRFLAAQGAAPAAVERIERFVLATQHTANALSGDAALVVDIDLSILGQPPDVYDEFERNVRREYWWVRKRRYCSARVAILSSFLGRTRIYHWPDFVERYEAPARANVQRAIAALAAA